MSVDFKQYYAMEVQSLIGLLKSGNEGAWEFIFKAAVNPFIFNREKTASAIRADRGIDPFEIYNMLYEEMILHPMKDGTIRLDTFRGEHVGTLIKWMRIYTNGLIQKIARKNPWPMSDECLEDSSFTEQTPPSRDDSWEVVQKCFGDLWRKSPMKAYIHLLRVKCGLSSRQIKDILGLETSEANIDQMFSRATKAMKELRDYYEDN